MTTETWPLTPEQRFRNYFSYYLTITLILSSITMIIGLILYSINPPPHPFDPSTMDLATIISEITQLSPEGILYIGVVLLLLSPVGGIVMSIFYYSYMKDSKLTLISIFVLIMMVIGVVFKIS